ncbi:MAG: type IV pilus assembly protein PilM [bacterium]
MFGSDRILALDIGNSKLVLAEFRVTGQQSLELVNYAVSPLGVDPESTTDVSAYIVSGIRDALKVSGIRPGPVSISVSGQMVFPRYVKLPPVTPDKISQIVKYEAQQNVPFPIDEVVWDYQLVGQDTGELSVLLVAVKGDLVKNLTDCVEAAGLDPLLVDVSPIALYNTVRYNYSDLSGCTMILDMGARSTNVVFVEGNKIFSRSIPVAGMAITKDVMKEFELSFEEAEQLKIAHAFVGFGGVYEGHEVGVADRTSKIARNIMTRLHAEVIRTINFYRSQQGGGQPSMVLLTGGCSVIPQANVFLKEKLKTEVDFLNPFRNVAVSSLIPSDKVAEDLHLLGEVVGLGLRRTLPCPVEINLLPPELAARRVLQRRLPFFALAAAGLVLIVLVFGLFLYQMKSMTEARLTKVQARIQELDAPNTTLGQLAKQKEQLYAKVTDLNTLIQGRTRWLTILDDLHQRLVPGMWLTSVRLLPVKEGRASVMLEIRGMAFIDEVNNPAIGEYVAKLKGTGYFTDDLEIKRIKPVENTDYATEFTVEIGLNNNPAVKSSELPVKSGNTPARRDRKEKAADHGSGKGNA